jgi:hypothetical protein
MEISLRHLSYQTGDPCPSSLTVIEQQQLRRGATAGIGGRPGFVAVAVPDGSVNLVRWVYPVSQATATRREALPRLSRYGSSQKSLRSLRMILGRVSQ